jgi:hypothetical protein
MPTRKSTHFAYLLANIAVLVLTACTKEPDAPPPKTSKSADVPVEIQVKKFQRLPPIDASLKVVLGGQCNLEALGGKLVVAEFEEMRRGIPLSMEGWAYGPMGGAGGKETYVLLVDSERNWNESSYGVQPSKAVSRPDVNAHLKLDNSGDLGIKVVASADAVPPGSYEVLFRLDRGDTVYICKSSRKVKLVD